MSESREAQPLTVTQAVEGLNALLSEQVLWIEGEVAEKKISQGKWLSFSLKDEGALLACFGMAYKFRVPLEDGMKVRVWGVPRIYPRYGKFSINLERIELSGEGTLKRAYELLRQKMEAEGLFDPARKRRITPYPMNIGLITSPDAAAYTDFLKVLQFRMGGIKIHFLPVTVQGATAAREIADAIDLMNEKHPELDALVLTRGGGSLEDLHAFNDETVVRTLARSRIPTVVGVGHERDTTLCDFAADIRCSTPSNAAELLVRTREEVSARLSETENALGAAVRAAHREAAAKVTAAIARAGKSLRRPIERTAGLGHKMRSFGRIIMLEKDRRAARLAEAVKIMAQLSRQGLQSEASSLAALEKTLQNLHPKNLLARGYSITSLAGGKIVRTAGDAGPGDELYTMLGEGEIISTVNERGKWPQKTHSQPRWKSSKRSSRTSNQGKLI